MWYLWILTVISQNGENVGSYLPEEIIYLETSGNNLWFCMTKNRRIVKLLLILVREEIETALV